MRRLLFAAAAVLWAGSAIAADVTLPLGVSAAQFRRRGAGRARDAAALRDAHGAKGRRPQDGRRDACSAHILQGGPACFSFFLYSGYIVSAPPRTASTGNPCFLANSSASVVVPGSLCGTQPCG